MNISWDYFAESAKDKQRYERQKLAPARRKMLHSNADKVRERKEEKMEPVINFWLGYWK